MTKFKNLKPQTKSFIILFCIAIVGTYLIVMLNANPTFLRPVSNDYGSKYYGTATNTAFASERPMPPIKPVDTSGWKTYQNKQYSFNFKYDPSWTIKPGKETSDGFYLVEVDPGAKYYNIKIYVSKEGFYVFDGLPAVITSIDGLQAYDVSNLLYGIKIGPDYYTFDNGLSTSLINDFNALVRSVKFN